MSKDLFEKVNEFNLEVEELIKKVDDLKKNKFFQKAQNDEKKFWLEFDGSQRIEEW